MAVGDFYKLTYFFENQGIQCVSVFHYEQTSGGTSPAADDLNLAFFTGVYPRLVAAMPIEVTITGIRIENLFVNSDFFENMTVSDPGSYDSEAQLAPSWLAVQFVSPRPYPGTRSARKRFPFLTENDVNGNLLDTTSSIRNTTWENLRVGIGNVISSGSFTFKPIVVYNAAPEGAPTPVWAKRYDITSYALSPKISSQDSRKS